MFSRNSFSRSKSCKPSPLSFRSILLPLAGLIALAWFLMRVIPKPSRAAYPCQRAAFPLASGFILWLMGTLGYVVFLKKARQRFRQKKMRLSLALFLMAALCAMVSASLDLPGVLASYEPADPPNTPLGVSKGIFPGRVVWVHEPDVTSWDSSISKRYWDSDCVSQVHLNDMLTSAVCHLAGQSNPRDAWHDLFSYFNHARGRSGRGYLPGERIAIKVNHVEQRSHSGNSSDTGDCGNKADATPQMTLALLDHLVLIAGVAQEDITVADPSRFYADKEFDLCHNAWPAVTFVEDGFSYPSNECGTRGRVQCEYTSQTLLHYSGMDPHGGDPIPIPSDTIPMPFYRADYIINLAIMKGHPQSAVTLSGKNWYGCLGHAPDYPHHNLAWMAGTWRCDGPTPQPAHYRSMVDMMGHRHLGGKTMLYLLDGLWGFQYHGAGSEPVKWQGAPFYNDYPSSLLASQDPVALDSVGLDFLRSQFADNMGGKNLHGAIDDYMHEAALAHDPPSGTFYDPERDGTPLGSLGVHEHWNGFAEKLYSVNLNTGPGIELLPLSRFYKRPSGTLRVMVSPENASWSLEGPERMKISGSGDLILPDAPTGQYRLFWQECLHHQLPEPANTTLYLDTDDTGEFMGVYSRINAPGGWLSY